MSKIHSISITNFKAIESLQADFNGCTAIITGANNKGKTSFLRGIPDRIRFIRPEVIVKQGEEQGNGEMTLDSGEKFIWEYNDKGKDKLTFVTQQGIKQPVTVEMGKRFFPPMFDIDKFLQSPPKEQARQLQKIIGIDFTDVDNRYQLAYNDRTEKNRDAERFHVKLSNMPKVDPVDPVDVTELKVKIQLEKDRLNALYLENKKKNDELRKKWNDEKETVNEDVRLFNKQQSENRIKYNSCHDAAYILTTNGFVSIDLPQFLESLKNSILPDKVAKDLYPYEPTYIEELPCRETLDKLENDLLAASEVNAKSKEYQDYIDYKNFVDEAQHRAEEADHLVKSIEEERLRMIESVKMPKGISITREGITVDGFPLDRNQISLSKLYTSALRIASLGLGEVKTLYFDASNLDRNNLSEIQAWAAENDLQLLIERPDFDAGEIKYELIENLQPCQL